MSEANSVLESKDFCPRTNSVPETGVLRSREPIHNTDLINLIQPKNRICIVISL